MQYSSVWAAVVAVSSLLGKIAAQSYPPFDASSIDEDTRNYWCVAQIAACPLLCQDQNRQTTENSCYPDNLYYVCTCTGGVSPNLTEYSQTIPYFICTVTVSGCITDCNGDPACANDCNVNRPCGATNPTRVNVTSTTTADTATSTASGNSNSDGSGSGFAVTGADGAATTGTGSGAPGLLLEAGQAYGLSLIVAGIAAGAAFMGF